MGGAAVDQTGRILVTGSADRTVRLWSASDGKLLRTVYLPTGPDNNGEVNAVAVSPDGRIVAAGGVGWDNPRGSNLYLFDRNTGKMTKRIGLPNWTFGLAFSADGRYLAAVGSFRGVIVFDRENDWKEARHDLSYDQRSYGVAFSRSGWLATTSADGKVRLYDPDFKRIVNPDSLSGGEPTKVAFSPDGKTVAVGYYDRPVVDLLDGRSLARQPGPNVEGLSGGSLAEVAWSSDGQTLFASGMYGQTARQHANSDVGHGRRLARGIQSPRPAPGRRHNNERCAPPDQRLFVAKASPCIMMLKRDGSVDWKPRAPNADFRAQWDTFSVSANGAIVDFGYGVGGNMPLRFDLAAGELIRSHGIGRPHPSATAKCAERKNRPMEEPVFPRAEWQNDPAKTG